jgi:hypothetical protein
MTAYPAAPAAPGTTPRLPRATLAAVAIWFFAAALAGASGVLAHTPFPIPQITILGLTVVTLVATNAVASVRAWIDAVPLRALVAVHAIRFVGIVFLILAARGQLAQVFADRAGWGDIAAATLALVLVASGIPRTSGHRALYHAWNALGALDLLVALGTATSVTLRGLTPGIEPVLAFPLSTIPLFFIPVLLVGHVLVFRRLVAAGRIGDR